MSDEFATHASAWRVATVYDVPLPPRDPSGTDATTSWAMVVTLLLLMPPLGWLQLRHRSDVDDDGVPDLGAARSRRHRDGLVCSTPAGSTMGSVLA